MNKAAKLIEQLLLLRCQMGDKDAFAELIERYDRSLRYFINRLLDNSELTEDIFQDNSSVLYCSTFQHPFYPYSGTDVESEHIINVALPVGAKGSQFRVAVTSYWLPILEAFKPELIFISAGFDAHIEDNMAGLELVETDFAWVTTKIKEIAEKLGFLDQFHFSKIFKKHLQMSPVSYRKSSL